MSDNNETSDVYQDNYVNGENPDNNIYFNNDNYVGDNPHAFYDAKDNFYGNYGREYSGNARKNPAGFPKHSLYCALSILCLILGNVFCGVISIALTNAANKSFMAGDMDKYKKIHTFATISIVIGGSLVAVNLLTAMLACSTMLFI